MFDWFLWGVVACGMQKSESDETGLENVIFVNFDTFAIGTHHLCSPLISTYGV